MEEPILDKALTFEHKGCEGLHYILGNPHTHPGRILGWCEHKQRSFFFSLSEIIHPTIETTFWIKGYLSGNEPYPPEINGDVDFKSEEYKHWQDKVKSFNETGYWEYE